MLNRSLACSSVMSGGLIRVLYFFMVLCPDQEEERIERSDPFPKMELDTF